MSENRGKTQETERGSREAKIETNTDNNIEGKMDMDESMEDGHLETFTTLMLKPLAVASERRALM